MQAALPQTDLDSSATESDATRLGALRAEFPLLDESSGYCVAAIDELIVRSGGAVAGVIVEVVQGEGGVRLLPKPFLRELREMLKQRRVLLIVDEVQTGFGRCGAIFATEHYGLQPDILAFSKAASGIGAPLAGIAFSKQFDGWPAGSFTGTFRGFAPALASGAKFLGILRKSGLTFRVREKGTRFMEDLRQQLRDTSIVGGIRGLGFLIGIDIVRDGNPDPLLARLVVRRLFDRGLITETGGVAGNVLRLLPPLDISDSCLLQAGSILVETLHEPYARAS